MPKIDELKGLLPQKEVRYVTTTLEVRDTDDKKRYIEGYAARFESLSEKLWFFREKIRAGAFQETLRNHNQMVLWNHDTNIVLGNRSAGTAELMEDDKGLFFRNWLPDTQAGRDAYESIKRGDVAGVSFGFTPITDEWDESNPQDIIRTLVKVRLYEVSPTPFPAYPQTSVNSRSIEDAYNKYLAAIQGDSNQDRAYQGIRRKKLDLLNKLYGGK